MNRKTKTGTGLLFLLVVGAFSGLLINSAIIIHGATDDTSKGSFDLNSTPAVTGVNFEADGYGAIATIDPDETTYYRLNFTITMSSGIDDILNCTMYIFDDSDHGADYDSQTPDGIVLTRFLWVEATDVWTVDGQGSLSNWDVDTDNSDDPGSASAETTFEFSMRFLVSGCAGADTDWNATVHVFDDDGTPEEDSSAEAGLITMNDWFSISFSVGTFSWGSAIEEDSTNNTHGALTITVRANTQWELRINGTDFNTSGESDVDIEANDIVCWDEDGSEGGANSLWVRNTIATAKGTWDNQGAHTTEAGENLNVYLFLNPGQLFAYGKTWDVWITIWVQANV
jgi:hypothetical protein